MSRNEDLGNDEGQDYGDAITKEEINEIMEDLVEIKARAAMSYIKLCPVCVRTAVVEIGFTGVLVPSKYRCPRCGWSGYVALEADIDDLIAHFKRMGEEET